MSWLPTADPNVDYDCPEAKQDWKNKKFASVPSDDKEFIPLPENK